MLRHTKDSPHTGPAPKSHLHAKTASAADSALVEVHSNTLVSIERIRDMLNRNDEGLAQMDELKVQLEEVRVNLAAAQQIIIYIREKIASREAQDAG